MEGGARVTVDPRAPAAEASAVFAASGAAAVLTDQPFISETIPVFTHMDEHPLGDRAVFPEITVHPSSPMVVYPRSVQNGRLFAVTISYGNWAAMMHTNIRLYRSGQYGPWLEESECFLAIQQIMRGTGFLGTFPFLQMGLPQVLVDSFDENRIIAAIARHRITGTILVPQMLVRLSEAAMRRPPHDVGPLRHVLYGGGRVNGDEIKTAMKALSPNLVQIYGRIEGGWPITVLGPEDHKSSADGASNLLKSCGRPIEAVNTKLRATSTEDSSVGELCVQSDMSVSAYVGPDGWCALGDIMSVDTEGYHYYPGRLDRMINNGFHVYPEEIEAVIGGVSGIVATRVFGEPDPAYGEIVAAEIVVAEGHSTSDVVGRVWAALEMSLARYKVPKVIRPVDALNH
jgi:acyl-CoA synthetase (AMP-forming)/AMP-acid ligase II